MGGTDGAIMKKAFPKSICSQKLYFNALHKYLEKGRSKFRFVEPKAFTIHGFPLRKKKYKIAIQSDV